MSPTAHSQISVALKGLARLRGGASRRLKALREYHITAMLDICPDTLIGRRDAAFLASGFAGALRRSELCNLQVADIEWVQTRAQRPWGSVLVDHALRRHTSCRASNAGNPSGMVIHIRKSKTDQAGAGQRVAIPEGKIVKPIAHLQRWLRETGIQEGYLFQTMRKGGSLTGQPLHPSDISRLVKHYVAAIGLNPQEFSAHSLRAGFVTSAAVHHARLDKIMEVTRHTNPMTVLRYIRDADMFANHAGAAFL